MNKTINVLKEAEYIQIQRDQDIQAKKGAVQLQHLSINEKIADMLTKPLPKAKFVYFRDKLSVVENFSLAEREC